MFKPHVRLQLIPDITCLIPALLLCKFSELLTNSLYYYSKVCGQEDYNLSDLPVSVLQCNRKHKVNMTLHFVLAMHFIYYMETCIDYIELWVQ